MDNKFIKNAKFVQSVKDSETGRKFIALIESLSGVHEQSFREGSDSATSFMCGSRQVGLKLHKLLLCDIAKELEKQQKQHQQKTEVEDLDL